MHILFIHFLLTLSPFPLDILRGVQEIQEELHPSFHRHKELVYVRAMESNAQGVRVHCDKSVLRLRCNGDHPI